MICAGEANKGSCQVNWIITGKLENIKSNLTLSIILFLQWCARRYNFIPFVFRAGRLWRTVAMPTRWKMDSGWHHQFWSALRHTWIPWSLRPGFWLSAVDHWQPGRGKRQLCVVQLQWHRPWRQLYMQICSFTCHLWVCALLCGAANAIYVTGNIFFFAFYF